MAIEIKSRHDDKVLYTAEHAENMRQAVEEAVNEGADLGDANLYGAYLRGVNLQYANLQYADLGDANLYGAYLRGAYLRGVNLQYANLRGAHFRDTYLRDAEGLNAYRVNDLLMLLDQPEPIRAYKLVKEDSEGIYSGGIKYEVGETVEVEDADTDPTNECGVGINLATLPWCLRYFQAGYRILICEFTKNDIAALPISDGKFRVHRCKVVGEKSLEGLGIDKDGRDLQGDVA